MAGPLKKTLRRFRSLSPRKRQPNKTASSHLSVARNGRAPSQPKFDTFDVWAHAKAVDDFFISAQCHSVDCEATLIVQKGKFVVCKHQLSHASAYFRRLFRGAEMFTNDTSSSARKKPHKRWPGGKSDEYVIVVGNSDERQQFQWFLNCLIPNPLLADVTDEKLEALMRLSRRFETPALQYRCVEFMRRSAFNRAPMAVLCWLIWCVREEMPEAGLEACLPSVARLPLITLEEYRSQIGQEVFGDLVAAKLRACYTQVAEVYRNIHRADHFSVQLNSCPRCGRTIAEEGGGKKLQLQVIASPCHKVVGCAICLRDLEDCVIGGSSSSSLQALYKCRHGTRVLNELTTECFCQQFEFRAKNTGLDWKTSAENGAETTVRLDNVSIEDLRGPNRTLPLLHSKKKPTKK